MLSVALSHPKNIWDICLPVHNGSYSAGGYEIIPYDPIMSFSYSPFGLVVYFWFSFLGESDTSGMVEQLMQDAPTIMGFSVQLEANIESFLLIIGNRVAEDGHG